MLLTNRKHSISACTINYPAIQALIINDVLHFCHFFPSATEETPFASHSRIGVLLYPRKIDHEPIFTRYHRTSPRICGSDTTPLCSSRAVMVNSTLESGQWRELCFRGRARTNQGRHSCGVWWRLCPKAGTTNMTFTRRKA